MKAIVDDEGNVLGTVDGNFTHWFRKPIDNYKKVGIDEGLAAKFSNASDPSHPQDYSFVDKKLEKKKAVPERTIVDLNIDDRYI